MKTRIVQTAIYNDPAFYKLSMEASWLCIYLLTSPIANLTGAFNIRKEQISLDTRIDLKKLDGFIKELHLSGLVYFVDDYFVITEKYRTNYNSGMTARAYSEEFEQISPLVKKVILEGFNSTIDSTMHSTYKIINKKSEIRNNKIINKKLEIRNKEIDLILQKWNSVMGVNLKSTKSIRSNFDIWRNEYTLEDMMTAIENVPKHHFWADKMKLETLFRTKNKNGDCDYIGELMNYRPQELNILNSAVGIV